MRTLSLAGLVVVVFAGSARAQTGPTTFTFDHYMQKDGGSSLVVLSPGDQFQIVLAHTCPTAFDYEVYKAPTVVQSGSAAGVVPGPPGAPTPPQNPSKSITKGPISHEARWGSYVLQVLPKAGGSACDVWVDANGVAVDPPADALKDRASTSGGGHWVQGASFSAASYVVTVQTNDWEVGVDVGPVFIPKTSKLYISGPSAGDPTKKVVTEDTDGEDPGRVAIGTLTHFYLPTTKWRNGPVAGFSILSPGNGSGPGSTEYYIGWGLALGPKNSRLNLAIGAAYAVVPTLPGGIKLGDAITDPSTIATLRNVYHWKFFFSFTGNAFHTGDDNKPAAPNTSKKQ